MGDKFVLRFLGLLETSEYTVEQSHGVPPVAVVLDHTTLTEEDSCGYSPVKTVRSIGIIKVYQSQKWLSWLASQKQRCANGSSVLYNGSGSSWRKLQQDRSIPR
jgi:hypothetical protein